MKKYFYIIIALIGLTFFSCGTNQVLPDEVCTYGNIICDYSQLVCNVYPESCPYITIACLNLTALCDSNLTKEQRDILLIVMDENNKRLKKQLQEKHKMNGWKTYLAAVLSIFYGIGFEGLYANDWTSAVTYILAGLGLLGIRSALTKVIEKK